MSVTPINNQYHRTPKAAEYCGLSVSTMEKLRLTGGGPIFIKRGRSVLYRQADLDAWMESLRRRSTSDQGGRAA
jgi:hypothetical protein